MAAAGKVSVDNKIGSARFRQRIEVERLPGGYALKAGKRLINFADNDYLGLSFHPEIIQAAQAALDRYGAGAGASRLVTGNCPLYQELEIELAAFKHTQDSLVFGSGFLANQGVITGLVGKEDIILADRLSHASLIDAVRLSGALFQRFRHNDIGHLQQLLQKYNARHCRCWIVVEGVYSMDGDTAPLQEIMVIAENYQAMLLIDDAHGFGVTGEGKGTLVAKGLKPSHKIIQTGTFSKAAGSYGGYVAADKEWISLLVNQARSLIYTTGLPPAVVAANLAAVRMIRQQPQFSKKAINNARYFCSLLNRPEPESAIVPFIVGSDESALSISQKLEQEGFLVAAIRPPTVPEGTSRLRIAFSTMHQSKDIERLAKLLASC